MSGLERRHIDPPDATRPVHVRPTPYWCAGLSNGKPLPVDLEQARRFLRLLDREESRHTFQLAPDRDGGPRRVLFGELDAVAPQLTRANEAGAAIYVVVNAGDLKGRKRANVIRVRCGVVDLDGAPLPAPLDHEAHAIVWTSPGKAHLYWRVADVPVDAFRSVQLGLAATFGGDTSVCDPPRVMRLPGFLHQKGTPYRVTAWTLDQNAPPYTLDELRARFPRVDAELRRAQEAVERARERRQAPRPTAPSRAAPGFPEKLLEVVARKAARIASSGRHDLLVWTARACLDNGLTEREAEVLTLRARDLMPARERGPVPDAEVLEAVAWAYATLTPGEPWKAPAAVDRPRANVVEPLPWRGGAPAGRYPWSSS